MSTMPQSAFTVTFGDRAENEYGMQMIGTPAASGLSVASLQEIASTFGSASKLIDLAPLLDGTGRTPPEAAVLVVKGGVDLLGDSEVILSELHAMPKDVTSLSYGRVVNKHARHNNCIGDFYQEPDIPAGRGTVVNFQDYPHTNALRNKLTHLMNAPTPLVGELNHYFDANKCGIGYHGDSERRIVAGSRFGKGADGMPLKFQWFHKCAPVGKEARIELDASDLYFFSDKAVGHDFKCRSLLTLRHAAGKDTCSYARTKRKRGEEHIVTVFA